MKRFSKKVWIPATILGLLVLLYGGPLLALKLQSPTKNVGTSTEVTEVKENPAPDLNLDTISNLVNSQRIANGIPALARSSALDHSAQDKCADMVARDYWSHDTPDGQQPWIFIGRYSLYSSAAENLAYGQVNEPMVISDWMNSPGHRENILNKELVYVGYAQCKYPASSQFGNHTVVVQHFITPAN